MTKINDETVTLVQMTFMEIVMTEKVVVMVDVRMMLMENSDAENWRRLGG